MYVLYVQVHVLEQQSINLCPVRSLVRTRDNVCTMVVGCSCSFRVWAFNSSPTFHILS